VQEKFLGQGPQDNESAIEQAKDEQISDYIRSGYKSATGSDIPIKDKVCSITPYRQLSMLTFVVGDEARLEQWPLSRFFVQHMTSFGALQQWCEHTNGS
jgi:hypothetical protein